MCKLQSSAIALVPVVWLVVAWPWPWRSSRVESIIHHILATRTSICEDCDDCDDCDDCHDAMTAMTAMTAMIAMAVIMVTASHKATCKYIANIGRVKNSTICLDAVVVHNTKNEIRYRG